MSTAIIRCSRSSGPVFTNDRDTEHFYVRAGTTTTELPPSQTQTYIQQRFR